MNTNQGSSVEFPAFCVADPAAARRRLPALGSTWAARFKESREFPQLETVPVEAGSLVFTESAFDLGGRPGVRIYLVPELLNAVQRALGWSDADEVMAAFETGIRRACWGALSLVTGRRRPDTVGSVRTRIEALLPCWSSLDLFKYVDAPGQPAPLASVVQTRFAGLLAMWLRHPTGDLPRDLMAALESLEAADAQTRLDAAARQRLAGLDASEREAIETGSDLDALTFLYAIDREHAS